MNGRTKLSTALETYCNFSWRNMKSAIALFGIQTMITFPNEIIKIDYFLQWNNINNMRELWRMNLFRQISTENLNLNYNSRMEQELQNVSFLSELIRSSLKNLSIPQTTDIDRIKLKNTNKVYYFLQYLHASRNKVSRIYYQHSNLNFAHSFRAMFHFPFHFPIQPLIVINFPATVHSQVSLHKPNTFPTPFSVAKTNLLEKKGAFDSVSKRTFVSELESDPIKK